MMMKRKEFYHLIFLRSIFVAVCLLPLFSLELKAQNSVRLTGTVKDEAGEVIIGAVVSIEGTTSSATVTDTQGNFVLNVPDADIRLSVSYVGYRPTVVPVARGARSVEVTMEQDAQIIDDIQVVAYGAQKKVTITGAISSISGEDLQRTPVGSLTNVLSGQVTGLSTVQYSGEPGADAAQIFVRGVTTLSSGNSAPLIQVDGVEREFSQIDPNEIESITVLKDASATAVFGVRGANGVILITTKRGVEGKPKISFSTSAGMQVPTKLLEFVNSYEYASFYNEAQINDGVDPGSVKFSPEVLEAFRTHSDPILYPDTDWLSLVLKDAALQTQHNINVSGGIEGLRYFVSVGMFTQQGLFKTFDAGYNFNFNFNRYNYRANLDFDLTKSTLLQVNLGGRIENKNTPISAEDQNQLFRHLYWSTPFSGPGIIDGKWIKTNSEYINDPGVDGLNPYYGRGYNARSSNVLELDVVLQQKLNFITEGLSLKIKGSYNSSYWHQKGRGSAIPYYTPVKTTDGGIEYMKSGDDAQLSYGENFGRGRDWYAEGSLNYDRSFGDHNVTALALYNQSKRYYPRNYSDIPTGYVGFVGRVTYDYKSRYMAEFNIGYNGSENFAPERRFGVFPAGSIGWIVTEEPFMERVKSVVNYLKLRASYGIVGNDKMDNRRFLYIPPSYVIGGDGYNFGTNTGTNRPGAYEGANTNPLVTWEKAAKQNYGIDISFLKERLMATVDVFKEHRTDILITNNTSPGFLGMTLPAVNMGIVDSHGYEISLKWNDRINKFRYWITGNLSYAQNKIIETAEVEPNEEYMRQTGHPVGTPSVRKFWGFYDDTAEERYLAEMGHPIAEHPGGLLPGDCVYVDLNEDGRIDSDDSWRKGYTDLPLYVAGLTVGFNWGNFDLNMQWTSGWNVTRMLNEGFREPMGDTNAKGLMRMFYDERWTPETAATATRPRASIAHKTNNLATSDLYLVDASYFRLKSLEIGYNMKFPFLSKAGFTNCRVYVSGYNLLTFSKFDLGDPESRTTDRPSYPLTRVFNLGLRFGF